jgi:hypothetical protein
MWKKTLILLQGCLLVITFEAGALELNVNRPSQYTVKPGDTLWEIAGRFLKNPWQWRELWRDNPQIQNPDLIYPGDALSLSYKGGRPLLQLSRGRNVKLSPSLREQRHDRAIPPIPPDAIWPFITRPRVVEPHDLQQAPYILSSQDAHLVSGPGDRVYVRGLRDPRAVRYTIVRCGAVLRYPPRGRGGDSRYGFGTPMRQTSKTDECKTVQPDASVLGYEAIPVAEAELALPGDPATVVITRAYREVLEGDRLLPEVEADFPDFIPRAPMGAVNGTIISILDALSQVGPYQVVVVDRGQDAALEPGHVLAIYQSGIVVRDKVAGPVSADRPAGRGAGNKVELPNELIGELMVFKAFARVSYALVMRAERPVHLYDAVRTP